MDFSINLHLKSMNRIRLFILLSLICSCSLIKDMDRSDVVGKYEYSDRISYYSSIQLKEDSTFELSSEAGLSSSKSEGIWEVKGRHVVLHSFYQPNDNGYEISEGINSTSDSITIKVVGLHGDDLPFTRVRLVKG